MAASAVTLPALPLQNQAPRAPSSVTLHGLPVSPYVQRVAMVLREVGVDEWKTVLVNPLAGETKTPDFLELNAFARIPVYEDDDVRLCESRAISRYLLEKNPQVGEQLLGNDIKERAEINKWVDLESTIYTLAMAPIIGETLLKKLTGQPVDEARLKEHVEKLSAVLDVYEKHLAEHQFLACDRLTFADLTHIPHTAMLEAAGYGSLLSSRPNVARWFATITARPSWAQVAAGPTIPKLVEAATKQGA